MTQRAAANKTFLQPAHYIGCKHTAQLLMQADIIQISLINFPPSASSPVWRSSQVKDPLPLCKRRMGDALGARRAKHTCLKLTFPQDTGHYTFPQATSALYFSPSHHQLGATKPIMHNSFPHQATTQPLSAIYRSLVLFAHYCCVLLLELAHYFLSVALRCPDASLIVLRLAPLALNALCNHDPFSQKRSSSTICTD